MDVSIIRNSQPAAIRPAPKLTDSQVGYLLKERVFDVASLTEALCRLADGDTVVDLTIVGTSSADHLRSNLAVAAKGPLPADVYEEAKRRLGRP